jgi:hypothetical protein
MNHLSTANALASPVDASAIAAKISGCSDQYAEKIISDYIQVNL